MSLRREICLVALGLIFGLASCEAGELLESLPGLRASAEEPGLASDGAPAYRARVILVPLRAFPEDLMVAVETGLETELDVEVVRHEPVELPQEAYYEPRRRYRAETLLDFLEQFADEADSPVPVKVLGLTKVDISTSNGEIEDWGIFGLGRASSGVAVVSSKRFGRRARNRAHLRFRVTTTAIHEIGHTFGLPHCNEHAVECVMLDAEGGMENTDTSSGVLGPECRKQLERLTGAS